MIIVKKLSELYNCNFDIPIKDIKINSKEVEKYDLFVCTKGVNTDRHDFIDEAIKNGASALVVEKEENYKVPFIKVEDTNKEIINAIDFFPTGFTTSHRNRNPKIVIIIFKFTYYTVFTSS